MYELFVLGELAQKSMHGYLLQRVVQEAIGPVRQMSWGALYPLLKRLERDGLITRAVHADKDRRREKHDKRRGKVEEGEGSGRERKLYRITPAGVARFQQLMAEPSAYDGDYPDLFTLKVSNFYQIDRATRLAILQHYRGYIVYIRDYLLASQQHITGEPAIAEDERPSILLALDHRLHMARADLEWIDGQIAHIGNDQGAMPAA